MKNSFKILLLASFVFAMNVCQAVLTIAVSELDGVVTYQGSGSLDLTGAGIPGEPKAPSNYTPGHDPSASLLMTDVSPILLSYMPDYKLEGSVDGWGSASYVGGSASYAGGSYSGNEFMLYAKKGVMHVALSPVYYTGDSISFTITVEGSLADPAESPAAASDWLGRTYTWHLPNDKIVMKTIDGTASAIPEPSTYAAWAGGVILGLCVLDRRRKPQPTA
ncbi:hypothetical protein [Cerasicoccus frondis]|uniref:hypothetical protein n=1 Tax=Cerasicoccus frondis TaxID=490090 RepID=UPI0028524F68|nr:hypothetical protein [Cerasicoccus frondis]